MPGWCYTALTPPPINETVMVKSGGSYFFAALTRFFGWKVVHGRVDQTIDEPEFWWDMTSDTTPTPPPPRAGKSGQLELLFDDNAQIRERYYDILDGKIRL